MDKIIKLALGISSILFACSCMENEGEYYKQFANDSKKENDSTNVAECYKIVSSTEDPTSAQITGGEISSEVKKFKWVAPAEYTSLIEFNGKVGQKASHEGIDFVNDDENLANVEIKATTGGIVVYVREGCPESSTFASNSMARECGAGWGNHVVIKHGTKLFTRYAHLEKSSILVEVGDTVVAGQVIAKMGNSGRSQVRHLHFELGTKTQAFDPCGMSQNFTLVHNPAQLDFQK